MMMKIILISTFLVVSAYNIDTNDPILYPNSAVNADQYLHTKFEHSYFGYSVLLHHDSKKNISWLLVGAPRGNYTRSSRAPSVSKLVNEPGVAYRCDLPGPCVEIKPAVINDEEIHIQFNLRAYIKKEHSWFGGAMSIERNGTFLTICAPRTIMSIKLNNRPPKYIDTMQGMCYSGQISSTTLKTEMSDIEHFDYNKPSWYDPIHGFSVTFATLQDERAINRIIGRPNHEITGTVNMACFTRRNFLEIGSKTTDIPIYDDQSQFGYVITSGYYFHRNQPLYACADPGWNYVGQVAIIPIYDPNGNSFSKMITNIHGSDVGEFFGASLATGDLNKDGLHDLVVGAPHWGNDNGRIYIYLGSSRKEFEAAVILEGASEDAQFGYAVASGDIDGDGFSDIIVSAPWEESGIIYIYNGDASLKEKVKPTVSQRIAMRLPNHNLPVKGVAIQTFGFSISEPIDIDNNGYADIAVGAYKSGHVVILRSKPVVRTNLTVYTVPSNLQRNVSNFLIKACVEYHGYDTANAHAFKVSLIIDNKYKRTKKTSLDLFSTNPPIHKCVNASIALSDNIQDFIEPITIYASHDFIYNNSKFCKTCSIESKGSKLRSAQALLSFDIECGADKVCNSNISAIMKFSGVRENNSWIIGSHDIILETHLRNHAEPAYLTAVVFSFPNGILLRSILPSCEEDAEQDTLMVMCNVGNPLGTNEQKIVKLDLDMRHLTNGSLHGQVLEFSMEIRTRSVNHGMHTVKSLLTLQSEASLLLNGKAIEKSYYLSNLDKDQLNITFQHAYQILKFGATSIEKAQLVINVPTATNDSDSLIFLHKPRIYISGEYYDCSSDGINIVNIQHNGFQGEISSDASNLYTYHLDNNNETLQKATHNILKRDVNSHTITAAHILQKIYDTKIVEPEDIKKNDNLTVRETDMVYLNCSTYGVNCSKIYCDLSALKTREDIGKLVMRLILNATKLKDNFELSVPNETKIVKFSTDAYVKIIKPVNRIFDIDVRRNINLTTEFHSTAKMQKLQLWIVLVSVSLGLILLCIVIIILNMVGFFKRKTKEELSALKMNEITEEVNKVEITDISE